MKKREMIRTLEKAIKNGYKFIGATALATDPQVVMVRECCEERVAAMEAVLHAMYDDDVQLKLLAERKGDERWLQRRKYR